MKLKSVFVVVIAILFLPVFSTPFEMTSDLVVAQTNPLPDSSVQGVYVASGRDNEPVIEYNQDQIWPIASLTKVMTALVFLEEEPNLNQAITLKKDDMVGGASLQVPVGTRFRADDLLHAALMSSANNATHALYQGTSLTKREFVQKMNDKAESLGLNKTHFVETTGLSPDNVSTPQEYAQVIAVALENPKIRKVMETSSYKIKPLNKRSFIIGNTNRFLKEKNDFKVHGAKTGLINESGFNLAVKAEKNGKSVVAVILGNSSWDESFANAKKLLSDAFEEDKNKNK